MPFVPADKIETLAQWIAEAERPVILAGGGVIASGATRELRALAESCRIPVAMSMPGMGAIRRARLCRWACAAMPAASMPIWRCTSPIF